MASHSNQIKKIAMIGCGSMGGGMALLFAEKGIAVSLQDPSTENMDSVMESAKKDGVSDKVSKYNDNKTLCESLDTPKVFVWSLPHGSVGDTVLGGLMPYLDKGDIIIDCGNEHWQNTERRQGKCSVRGIRYVGCGVSGGYQAARRGPSMCPGGDDAALDIVLPTLQMVAAKASDGSACVGRIGAGGAGHYCKMIHNGIEHGMMSAISEAWAIMHKGMGLSLPNIGKTFEKWSSEREMKNTFLLDIGVDICQEKEGKVLESVEDKVVQDVTGEEGTGIWSNDEAIEEHVPAPTLAAAHFLRLASSDLHQRREVQKTFGGDYPPKSIEEANQHPMEFLNDMKLAVYVACLAAYIQGLNTIDQANKNKRFNINYSELLQVWRNGCIIRSDHINEELLAPLFANGAEFTNPLYVPPIVKELKEGFAALRRITKLAVAADHVVPALSATLEYLKYQTSTDLPTSFYEAELDYFGSHMFDKKGEDPEGKPTTGKHHYEWKLA
ncbi:hypothetical protein LTR37_000094 [Vermiconidia calcicola]|uniref:Uncharacterized protein n=1 Tax=Vermiconidia calcicola TaxID=1690605 RepID=A0ACC3NZI6_9PEZI|nr:hypothetical protein LTR37_000094 [Vermiconidia calcicola]